MAEEKNKKEESKVVPPEAEKAPEADRQADSTVDAESSPRQKEETVTSERRGEDTASTVEEASPSPQEEEKSAASAGPDLASEKKPAEPDWKTLYAVTLADFDNYKKRAARDREDVYRYAESDILKDVLPALDNLQLALAAAKPANAASPTPDKGDATFLSREKEGDTSSSAFVSFVKGVQLVYDTLLKSLKDHGAEPFDSVGKDLDTEKMEAIATLPHAEIPEGKVSIESKKGWMLKGKVLRAAQVVVSSGKPA